MTQDRHKEYMFSTDAFMTPQMERKAEETGVRKGEMGWRNTFALSILAGAFIAMALFMPPRSQQEQHDTWLLEWSDCCPLT